MKPGAKMKDRLAKVTLLIIIVVSFIYMMTLPLIRQNPAYHAFAANKLIWGIPNFADVISNIFFALFGLLGLRHCLKHRPAVGALSWRIFFLGVALVSLGSAWYHLWPANATLVWDRLPMTIGFMGLFSAILSEYVDSRLEKYILIPLLLAGFGSVIYWHYSDDLRFYYWIQLIPLLIIPFVLLLFKSAYTHQRFLLYALGFYLLAKISESQDRALYDFTGGFLSGHTLKHLLASLAPLMLYLMIRRRSARKTTTARSL